MRSIGALKRVCLLAGAAALAAAIGGCEPRTSSASPSGEDAGEQRADPIPVETMSVQAVDFVETFEVPATARPADEVTVAAETGGRILRTGFEKGDEVRAGSALLTIDTQIDSARIKVLDNQLESARREYERTKKLANDGLATPKQLDQAETALNNARLNLEQAKVGLSKARVSSPMSGVVAAKFVEAGEFAAPGAPVARIVDYSQITFEGQVPERRVRHVRPGEAVEIYVPALDVTVAGTVEHRSLDASPKTGTYTVEVAVDNADGQIFPGMSGRIEMVRKEWEHVVIVPREAVLQGFARSEAMVLTSDGQAEAAALRVIELGPSSGPDVLVTAGLEPGEALIVRGHRGLVNSALVEAVRHFDSIEQMRAHGASPNSDPSDQKKANQKQADPNQ